jgi:hypothetical protein
MKFVVNVVACKRNILQIWKSSTKDFYVKAEHSGKMEISDKRLYGTGPEAHEHQLQARCSIH